MSETPIFGITEETVLAIDEKTAQYPHVLEYAKSVFERMVVEQPKLYKSIRDTAVQQDWMAYAIGTSLTYDAITMELSQRGIGVEITEQDLEVHNQNVIDFIETPF